MKYFPEIVRIITRLREQKIEVVEEGGEGDLDSATKLYLGIKSGEFKNDRIAARSIYGEAEVSTKYTTLKNRLKKRLFNTVFFLDLKQADYSEYAQAHYKCRRNVFIIETFYTLGARESSIRLAESTLKIAERFHLIPQALDMLLILRENSMLQGHNKEYERYCEKINHYLEVNSAEAKTQEFFERLSIKYALSSVEQPNLVLKAREFADRAKRMFEVAHSYKVALNYFRIKALSHQIAQEFNETIRVCDEAERYLDAHPHLAYPSRYAEFVLKRLICFLHLRDYENGKYAIDRGTQLFKKGMHNWFVFMEYYLVFTMHTQRFEEAENVFHEVVKHPTFNSLPEQRKEKWKIYELFLQYALKTSNVANSNALGSQFQFNLKQFLRNVPTYYKDKQGMNISVLIMHILYLLEENNFSAIIDRMEALKTYRSRYLRVKTNRHSALFFKLLLIMESNSFNYRLTKMKAQKYYDRLVETTADYTEISEGLQILPFDWLWQRILTKLREHDLQQKMQTSEMKKLAA